ncbi:MAG: VCBS repeat-containing protein, partial [Planctomycetota bacterium]
MKPFNVLACLALLLICHGGSTEAQVQSDRGTVHSFHRQSLTKTYFSEGAGVGDLNADGKPDVVYGPYWFEGPEFKVSHEIYT